jgi:recombination protein RecT
MNELALFEQQLQPLSPKFSQVLGQTMPVERLIRTVVISAERVPKLLQCNRQSLFNAAMTFAVLGLEVDGVTGQGYLLPFNNVAQPVIGYKGYNTLAARSRITITGEVVREGDDFDYELGSHSYVRHKPKLGSRGRIIAAWACGASNDRPPVVSVLDIDEIMSIKARSPGAKLSQSPWNEEKIGFPAMASKTAKRRLARVLPLSVFQLAARMDEVFEEQGKPSRIDPDKGVIVDGEYSPIPEREASETPSAAYLMGTERPTETVEPVNSSHPVRSWAEYERHWRERIQSAAPSQVAALKADWNAEKTERNQQTDCPEGARRELLDAVGKAISFLEGTL